jgi:D-arabinose 1-dehydrogenase-like Zn-dependent alcohol dehydrogenase
MVLTRFGGPDGFRCEEVNEPAFGPDQMLVRVGACGVCGHDLLNRAGYFPGTRLPVVMGHEIAGTVERVGDFVTRFKVGDRVALIQRLPCGLCEPCRAGRENLCRSGAGFYGEEISGGYGAYVIAAERNAVPLPAEISLRVGAVLSCAIGTGFHALHRTRLRLGDTVVVTGASGGVGIHTVKLGRAMGLRVVAVSSSPAKADRLRAAGADEVIAAPDYAFHNQVRELTGGLGADAAIEIAGARTFVSSMRSLKAGGRMVLVGTMEPGNVPLNPALSILKEIELIGSAHATTSDLRQVIELVRAGRIAPEIAAELPIEEAAEAHAIIEARSTAGRVVLLQD